MQISFPEKIMNNYRGYGFFTDLFIKTAAVENERLILDFEDTWQFEANMCAVLRALLHELEDRGNRIQFENLYPNLQKQIARQPKGKGSNAFNLQWKGLLFGRHFSRNDEAALSHYIDTRLFGNKSLIEANPQLKMAISLCLAELFRNAFTHSDGGDVFLSHYYKAFKKRLYVTIVSWGKTLKEVVSEHQNKEMRGVDAINWAVNPGNSVLEEGRGSGLHTIRQFIQQNNGKVQIISADGVWKQVKQRTFYKPYQHEFPGTIITLEFNIEE